MYSSPFFSSYVPWNVHELSPGQFTFSGASDLPRFLSLAKEADMVVLLRLGPYICGEWEFVSVFFTLTYDNIIIIIITVIITNKVVKWSLPTVG